MEKSTKKTKLLSTGFVAVTIFTLIAGIMSCDNGTTTETARDVKIAEHQGKNIYVNCLPSQDELKDKIATQVESILSYSEPDSYIDKFKNYIQQKDIKIIIEDVSEYGNGKDYRIVSDSAFALRVVFVSSASVPKLYGAIVDAVCDMNNQYHVVLLDRHFNNTTIDRQTKSAYIAYQKRFNRIAQQRVKKQNIWSIHYA
jgi:hypothetical protein